MSAQEPAIDGARISVGAPLPWSVYSAERKLLLARGSIVESERVRNALLRAGRYLSNGTSLQLEEEVAAAESESPTLDAYVRDTPAVLGQSRIGVHVSRDETSESYVCWLLGADEEHGLMVSAPSKPDRSLIAINEGQTWVFRLMYMTAAVKFAGVIRKTHYEPVPMLYVAVPAQVDMRQVRASPRVASCVRGRLDADRGPPLILTDLSTGGARIVIERGQAALQPGQVLHLRFTLPLLDGRHVFEIKASVVSLRREFEQQYPDLCFAGVKFDALTELQRLILHGYVYERMAMDFNSFWRVLCAR